MGNKEENEYKILQEKKQLEELHRKKIEAATAQAAGMAVGAIIIALIYGLFFSKHKSVRVLSLAILIGGIIYFFGDDIANKFKHTYCRYCGTAAFSPAALAEEPCPRHPKGANRGNHDAFPKGRRKVYVCALCGEAYTSLNSLLAGYCPLSTSNRGTNHVPYVGPEKGPYKCVFCGQEYEDIATMVSSGMCPNHPEGRLRGRHCAMAEPETGTDGVDTSTTCSDHFSASGEIPTDGKRTKIPTATRKGLFGGKSDNPVKRASETTDPAPSIDKYMEMSEEDFLNECGTFLNVAKLGGISNGKRISLANLLVFRDAMRTAGVPDAAFKASLASGGIKPDGLASRIDSATDFPELVHALETCFTLAKMPDWMRHELMIRVCFHHFLYDEQDRGRDIINAVKGGKESVQTEALVLEATEILRCLSTIDLNSPATGNSAEKQPTSSADFANRILQGGKVRGIGGQWIRELGKWGIAWNIPDDASDCIPVLTSPGFPCNWIPADQSRIDETFQLSQQAIFVCKDGSIRKIDAGESSWRFIFDEDTEFREALGLTYLTPNGVKTPLLNKNRYDARKFEWLNKCRSEWGRVFWVVQKGFAQFGGFGLAQPPLADMAFDGDFQKNVPLRTPYRNFKTADLVFKHGMLVAWRLKAHYDESAINGIRQNALPLLMQDVGTRLEGMNAPQTGITFDVLRSGYGREGPIVSDPPWTLTFCNPSSVWAGEVKTSFSLEEVEDGYDLSLIIDARKGMQFLMAKVLGIPVTDLADDMWREPLW